MSERSSAVEHQEVGSGTLQSSPNSSNQYECASGERGGHPSTQEPPWSAAGHILEVAGSNPDRSDHLSHPRVAQGSEHRADNPTVGAFESSPADHFRLQWPALTWGQALGPPDCPYMTRWVLDFGAFALRVHKWSNSDDLRHPHDHPWDYWTLVLWGCIIEHTETGTWERRPGSFHAFTAEFKHCVEVQETTWTLMFTGPERRPDWGFWAHGKFRKRNKYFREHGHHHPCDPTRNKVRRRERGKKIKTYAELSREKKDESTTASRYRPSPSR